MRAEEVHILAHPPQQPTPSPRRAAAPALAPRLDGRRVGHLAIVAPGGAAHAGHGAHQQQRGGRREGGPEADGRVERDGGVAEVLFLVGERDELVWPAHGGRDSEAMKGEVGDGGLRVADATFSCK